MREWRPEAVTGVPTRLAMRDSLAISVIET
jgi:hypothetical protein